MDVARLVHHARQAGDAEAVRRYAPEAAREAAASRRTGKRRALPDGAVLRRAAARRRGRAAGGLLVPGYLSGLRRRGGRPGGAAHPGGRRRAEKLGEGLRWLSRLTGGRGRRAEAEAAAGRAIAVLETLEPGQQLAMAYSNQAQLDMLAYRPEAAMGWASRALELARRLGDQETRSHALTNIGSARLLSGDPGGRVELEQAFKVATAAGLEDHAARALVSLATITADMRDYHHAGSDLDRAWPSPRARPGRLHPAPAGAPRLPATGPGALGRRGAGRPRRPGRGAQRRREDPGGGGASGPGPAAGTPRRPGRRRHAGGGRRNCLPNR